MWMIGEVFRPLANIFFPPRCIGCGKKGEPLCMRCVAHTRKALDTPGPHIVSFFDFKDPVIRQAIHAIKYYHRRDLVAPLATPLAQAMRNMPNLEKYVLVPVAMPHLRKFLRGYNQAELIAKRIGKELSLPIRTDILVRTRFPLRQAKTKTRAERMENQKGSFRTLVPTSGMRIVLIDDVITTGATVEEARNTLLRSGAVNVLAASLAH